MKQLHCTHQRILSVMQIGLRYVSREYFDGNRIAGTQRPQIIGITAQRDLEADVNM